MKKISTIIVALLVTFNLAFSQNTHIINVNGMSFSPDTTICNIGDTIIFNLGGYHNAVEVSSATWIGNGTSSNGGFSFQLGTLTGTILVDTIKTYYYVCTPHVSMGMKAVIISNYTDCNGIVNGSSLMDTCGVCQQSYIYDYVTHAVTMLNDTMNVTLGPTEMLVLADDPSNPYWNSSCTDCNGVINGSSLMDTCGVCQQSYIYDFVTHAVTMLNDTMNVTLGPTEMLVLADDPSNPYWNDCDSTTTNIVIIKDSKSRTLVRIADILGRDTEPKNNAILFYIYNDGTIEKKVTLE